MSSHFFMERVPGLYLKDVPGKGRGVFSGVPLDCGVEIEVYPVVVFSEADATFIDKTVLYNYYFSAQFLSDKAAGLLNIQDKEKAGILALGMLSLCNHSDKPNARIEKRATDKGDIIFSLCSIRKIAPDEEILISYGKVWFDVLP
jgi:SET domain-containing protein